MQEAKQEQIIKSIYDIEWEMFYSVNSGFPSNCQQNPKAFRLMRWMTHSVLPLEVLESYLNDLYCAVENGRNLMSEKYLRMDDRIPVINDNPLIDMIVDMEVRWFKKLADEYPLTFRGEGVNFQRYLQCELETYSNSTLELYHKACMHAKVHDINLAMERYSNLFAKLGYSSIKEREQECASTCQV